MATVNAGAKQPDDQVGTETRNRDMGRPLGIPPKRDPMVATGSLKRHAAAVPANMAYDGPGMRFRDARQRA